MFWNLSIRLWSIKAIYIIMTTHTEILVNFVLFSTCDIIEIYNWMRFCFVWVANICNVWVRKISYFFDFWKHLSQIPIFRLIKRFWINVTILKTQIIWWLWELIWELWFSRNLLDNIESRVLSSVKGFRAYAFSEPDHRLRYSEYLCWLVVLRNAWGLQIDRLQHICILSINISYFACVVH